MVKKRFWAEALSYSFTNGIGTHLVMRFGVESLTRELVVKVGSTTHMSRVMRYCCGAWDLNLAEIFFEFEGKTVQKKDNLGSLEITDDGALIDARPFGHTG